MFFSNSMRFVSFDSEFGGLLGFEEEIEKKIRRS